jgi:hypothetical protein
MSLIVKDNGKDYKVLEPGLYQAVCSHVVDMGEHDGQYGIKSKIGIVFELAEKRDDGQRYQLAMVQGNTLASKGYLRATLESWRGKKFTDEELKDGFDLERLIGANCYLNITHDIKENKTYLKINSIVPLPKNIEKIFSLGIAIPEWIVKKTNEGLALRTKLESEINNKPNSKDNNQSSDDEGLPF